MIEYEERDQAEKKIEVEKPELEKNTKRSLKIIYNKKDRRHKKCRSAHEIHKRRKQQQQEQMVKMLKRKQKKSKECAKES